MPSKKVSPVPDLDTIDISALGIGLQRQRVDAGLTLEGLAERTGIPRNTIHRYENGKLNPTAKALLRLAIGLGINVSELVKPLNHLR
ncbi:helix-turn-helix transcriptional regulator [Mycobacteroides abscessus subsp. abscessus]|uniref:helix-turn-helix domain-containing protein n=1 Tax=Mycobacteroides abscessus TaxID=36809 RepID=UPI0009A77689|nr:helix-turn-helix transcriptional regulator [Mycobacteroides abscessus]MBN7388540.1 helix-turn-helix transcriptional regulator [Mycobacteroides abscessus subsp. abscessus]MBN7414810.1 helix-turn-helix transcriptional regulator [Mycobacteroides abscessus subsp. abscessus]MDO2961039.1 helix-turn-helix transcriptional regulator [Mycobacteroides abscessus subsp. abscessus]MDO2995007.1 helix-turn-helix transcriptional regulator [Mycobacteroides abscessus subsp. abscessus]MDO3064340.1 helix-turn-h